MRFRAESVRALRLELEASGGGLWLSSEEPVYAVNRIQQQYSVITLVCDEPVATEERLEVARLEAEGYPTVTVFVDDLFRKICYSSLLQLLAHGRGVPAWGAFT